MAIKVIKYSNAKTTMNLKKNPEQIHVKVPMLIETLTNHSMTDYESAKNRKKLQKYLEKEFEQVCKNWLKKHKKNSKLSLLVGHSKLENNSLQFNNTINLIGLKNIRKWM